MITHHRLHQHPRRIMPLFPALVGLVFILIGSLHVMPAQAQGSQIEQVQLYIERNAELLEWAFDIVRETENVPARRVLEEAVGLHRRSVRLLDDNHPLMAYNTAKHSRTATRNAVRMARESMGFEERVRLRVERFRDQHSRLLEKARDANNQRALDFLRRSEATARRANEQYQQGDAQLAFKMLEQAEELMNRAGRMLSGGSSDRLEQKMEMARMAVERAEESLQEGATPAARKLMEESEHALGRALDFRDQGQPERALQMANVAVRLANRAMGSSGGAPEAETVERQIERWDERYERITESVLDAGDDSSRRILQRARDQRGASLESLNNEEFEKALRQIRAAHDLLTQAEDMVR